MSGADVAATMAATFVDEWVRAGISDVVIAPGSRSTPMALAVFADRRLRPHVHVDERSASFLALGLGLASGRPAPVVTTSGTAAVELHAAVVEAHHAAVPMIVCTADRPPELRGIGSPQTIDQRDLYGRSVRLALDLEPPDGTQPARWRSWAAQSVLAATGSPAGPVHCNLGFREPLLGVAGELPAGRPDGGSWHRREGEAEVPDLADLGALVARAERGVVVAGGGCRGASAVVALADRLGWPVLADPTSGVRSAREGVVSAFDPLLRDEAFARARAADVAIQFGAAPASRALQDWLDLHGTTRAVVGVGPELPIAGREAEIVLQADPGPVAAALVRGRDQGPSSDERRAWSAADGVAQQVMDRELAGSLEEPAVARTVLASLPAGGAMVVSSSMPIRDIEWYSAPRDDVTVSSNRGANGIDGVVSTAVGVALDGRPTVGLLGDLAFLHDSNGLLGAATRGIDLTLVVVDNDGGGIFSFLPQADRLPAATFEAAFGTPHGLDLVALASAHGLVARRVTTATELVAAASEPDGVSVAVVESDRQRNVAVHAALNAAVADALRGP